MSKPRYDWWGYVKGMIRRYPELCAKEKELHTVSISPDLSGMPHGRGNKSDPTANAALRELPDINRREMEAVRKAIEETRKMETGEERLRMVRLVFWDKTYTLVGAAKKCNIAYITARRWHGDFIRYVGKAFGFFD